MIYADYMYYKSDYFGTLITDNAEYDRLATRAAVELDYYTHNRAQCCAELDAVKMCSCAVADRLKLIENAMRKAVSDEPEIQSETVGSFSRTYKQTSDYTVSAKQEIRAELYKYLGSTGLLYGGIVC